MTKEEIFEKLKESIHDNHDETKNAEITMESDYDSVGIDSLGCVLVVMDMEEEYNISISDDEAEACKTVSSFVDMIHAKIVE
jgi:acyl carrier protein